MAQFNRFFLHFSFFSITTKYVKTDKINIIASHIPVQSIYAYSVMKLNKVIQNVSKKINVRETFTNTCLQKIKEDSQKMI